MFATQHYMETIPDGPKKRGREDGEELPNGALSFSEHRNKRIQSLPFRTSPAGAQQLLPTATITPLNASPGSQLPNDQFAVPFQPQQVHNPDADMDMSDSTGASTHAASSMLSVGNHVNTSARMPTPIQPSFAAQVRGQQSEWAGPNPASLVNPIAEMGNHQAGFPGDHSVPRIMAGEADWHAVQNNRRLPSPISECDDAMHSAGLPMDEHSHGMLSAQLEGSSISSQPPSPHSHSNGMSDADAESLYASQSADGEGDSPGPSPSRRGHMRSKHTINTWTWQPGMKRSFSIGYRADCEKCRLNVPGHFNHIIIS